MVYLLPERNLNDEFKPIVKQQPLVIQIAADDPLPPPQTAWGDNTVAPGLLAIGGGLSLTRLLEAYGQGCFPWYSDGQPVMWWCTHPRMVLPCESFKLHRSLRKQLVHMISDGSLEIRINHDFESVIQHCARAPRSGQSGTWIVKEMIQAYIKLHQAGHAHSVETWVNGQLVGGLYCVAIGRSVFGESMFSLCPNASKMALAALVCFCKAHQIKWIDCQQKTSHLASLGAQEISRDHFLEELARSNTLPPMHWEFQPIYWQQILNKNT
jgi:leucyl/phenylalanyl-tRNA--protein transferase